MGHENTKNADGPGPHATGVVRVQKYAGIICVSSVVPGTQFSDTSKAKQNISTVHGDADSEIRLWLTRRFATPILTFCIFQRC